MHGGATWTTKGAAVKTWTVWEDYFHYGHWQVCQNLQLSDTFADREIAERYAAYMNKRDEES